MRRKFHPPMTIYLCILLLKVKNASCTIEHSQIQSTTRMNLGHLKRWGHLKLWLGFRMSMSIQRHLAHLKNSGDMVKRGASMQCRSCIWPLWSLCIIMSTQCRSSILILWSGLYIILSQAALEPLN